MSLRGAVHGLEYWYHVESKDLIYWKNIGVCIRPDTICNNKGAYSGSALVTDHSIYLYYTGNQRDSKIIYHKQNQTCYIVLGAQNKQKQ